MIIGILVSGIVAGLMVSVGALTMGLPIWAAIVLYPLAGSIGAIGFIAMAMGRGTSNAPQATVAYAAEARTHG